MRPALKSRSSAVSPTVGAETSLPRAVATPLLHHRKLTRRHLHMPVPNTVGGKVKEQRPARCRRQVLQQFDAGPGSGRQAANAKSCSEYIV